MQFQIPIPTSRLLNSDGVLDRQWYQFLNNIQQVTGGTITVPNGGTGLTIGTDGGVLGFIAPTTIASSGTLGTNQIVLGGGAGATPLSLGSLGTTVQVLHGNAAGQPSFASVANADMATMPATTLKGNNSGGAQTPLDLTVTQVLAMLGIGSPITNSLSGDVSLNNVATYFDGPSVAQGTTGTWFVSGTVTLSETASANFECKLWDGTTVISSCEAGEAGALGITTVASLSGVISSPVGNIRISVKDGTSVNGKIIFNSSGNSKDSTITAFRIA